jgi:S1-C subfamily serine protease
MGLDAAKQLDFPDFGLSDVRKPCRQRSQERKVPEATFRKSSDSIGSGVIVDSLGDVVSSARLIADARKLVVRLYDGSQRE